MKDSRQNVEKLHHFITNSLVEVESGYFEYDEWKIFNDPKLLLLVTKLLYIKIIESKLEFEYIGALGGSGTPLAVSLMQEFFNNGQIKKFMYISDPLFGVSSLWVRKIKPDFDTVEQPILFVDTEVKSGRTLLDGFEKVQQLGAKVNGIAAITDYKGFPERSDYDKIITDQRIPLIALFDFYPQKPHLKIK